MYSHNYITQVVFQIDVFSIQATMSRQRIWIENIGRDTFLDSEINIQKLMMHLKQSHIH